MLKTGNSSTVPLQAAQSGIIEDTLRSRQHVSNASAVVFPEFCFIINFRAASPHLTIHTAYTQYKLYGTPVLM
jgi:hypothetical protein